MASFRTLYLVLLFTSILISHEARSLPPSTFSSTNQSHNAFAATKTKTLLKEILLRKQLVAGAHFYEPDRLSPGGPDPSHH
ncbi:unnamed protein product [Sphenostylis stenocarpa]|uniref:Uncharacterized protein n=1 Tax=Sphenostylis stenocarpa TaxID=92480 RepID=A0AA86W5U0_9FABA|nr:unnamed protein product [Sphenostylis stenocarpa]